MPPLPPPDDSAGGIVGSGWWGKFVSMAFLVVFFANSFKGCQFQNEQRTRWDKEDERERTRRAEWEQRK